MPELALVEDTTAFPEVAAPAVCPTAHQIEERYLAGVNALVDDALGHQNMPILADVLAWTLGRVIVAYGTPAVAGDVLRRLGGYVCDLVERQRAQAEADRARKERRKPH